jgi:hypothetical protein
VSATKYVRGDVDFTEWHWSGDGLMLGAAITEQVSETVTQALKEPYAVHADMPFMWAPDSDGSHGPAVDDPLTIYISLDALGDGRDDYPIFRTSFAELLSDFVDAIISPDDMKIYGDDAANARIVVAKLRHLADGLESFIAAEVGE